MSANTSIEWTDRTWNPTTGCDKVSPGCAHCYAEGVAERFWAKQYQGIKYTDAAGSTDIRDRKFTDVQTHEDRLLEPLSWRKPSKVFVNSMSDLFHEDVPDAFIDKVFAVTAWAPRHTFQILTKRPERMRAYLSAPGVEERINGDAMCTACMQMNGRLCGYANDDCQLDFITWPLPNVWLGVSVENQHFADARIPLLLQTPAAVRFISAEPLLGPVDLGPWLSAQHEFYRDNPYAEQGGDISDHGPNTSRCIRREHLDWVIVGGESGPGARPFDLAWARAIVQQCKAASVPVFMKQVGAYPKDAEKGRRIFLNDRKGGDPEEWPADLKVREFPR